MAFYDDHYEVTRGMGGRLLLRKRPADVPISLKARPGETVNSTLLMHGFRGSELRLNTNRRVVLAVLESSIAYYRELRVRATGALWTPLDGWGDSEV